MGFFGSVKNFVSRAVGKIMPVVRSVGGVIRDYHPQIAMGLHGLAHSTNNETLKSISNAGLLASGVASGLGYGGKHPIMPDKVS